jgi:fimbrial chaperone protein
MSQFPTSPTPSAAPAGSLHRRSTIRRLGLLLAALCIGWPALPVMAELSLFPTRIVLERNQRAAQVELVNRGSEPETYRIGLVNRRMTETGEIVPADHAQPDEKFAEEMLRFSPRQVTIPPGGSQTVRILLRKPADLAPGEYRSHLQFDRVEDTAASSSIEAAGKPAGNEIGVVIKALVGASIPVIVRHGDTDAKVSLSDLSLIPASGQDGPLLAMHMNRSGNRSVYGDLSVTITPAGGKPVEVAKAGGVAVYVPNTVRRATMPLQIPQNLNLAGATLQLSYRERPEAGARLMAEATLKLP